MLSKTRTVLYRDRGLLGQMVPVFNAGVEEDGRNHHLILDRSVWEDLGEPDVITVAIEPGDQLNDGTLEEDYAE